MARKVDPLSRRLLMEGVHPMVSDRTGAVTYRARWSAVDPWGTRHSGGKVFKSADEAEAFLLETQLAVRRGTYRAPVRLTVGDYWAQWFARMRHTWKGTTTYHADRTWQTHLAPRLGHQPLDRIDRATCQRLVDELTAAGMKGSSIKAVLSPLRKMLRAAVTDGLLTANPAADLIYPAHAPAPKDVWSALQVRRFLTGTRGTPQHRLWVLLATTGCRISEALALQWRDLDLSAGTLHIRRTMVHGEHGPLTYRDGTKTSAGRVVPMEPALRVLFADAGAPDAWVFSGRGGLPWRRSTVRDQLNREIARLGMPKLTLHGFRHTAATLMLASGVSERIIQEILGHGSIQTTMDQYTRVTVETQRLGTRVLSDLVTPPSLNATTSDPEEGDRKEGNGE